MNDFINKEGQVKGRNGKSLLDKIAENVGKFITIALLLSVLLGYIALVNFQTAREDRLEKRILEAIEEKLKYIREDIANIREDIAELKGQPRQIIRREEKVDLSDIESTMREVNQRLDSLEGRKPQQRVIVKEKPIMQESEDTRKDIDELKYNVANLAELMSRYIDYQMKKDGLVPQVYEEPIQEN